MNIELQVIGSALRAVAEEMGAALIRSAFSANIKERRDCSTALFDARGRLIAQAEHIPVHLGAMPDAVAAVRLESPGRTTPSCSTTPTPAALIFPTSRSSRAPRSDSPSRAPTTPTSAGSSPAACRPSPTRSRTKASSSRRPGSTTCSSTTSSRECGTRRNGSETSGPSSLRSDSAVPAWEDLCARHGHHRVAAAMDELHDYSERVVRAGIARLPDGRYAASDVLEPVDGELEIHAEVTIDGDALGCRLRRHLAAARREPQLSDGGDPLGLLLRRARPDRPRYSRVGRRLRPGHGDRARGMVWSTHGRRLPSPPGTRRRPPASSTPSFARSGTRSTCRRRDRGR